MGVPAGRLFDDDERAGETLLQQAVRLEHMANELLSEAQRLRARIKSNEPTPPGGLRPVPVAKGNGKSPVTLAMDYFTAQHKLRVRDPETGAGLSPVIQQGKDPKLLKMLTDQYTLDVVCRAIDAYFEFADQWTQKHGYTIGGLKTQFPGLLNRLSQSSARGRTERTASNQSSAAEAAEIIEQQFR